MASFSLDLLLMGPICKYSHIQKYQELGFNMNLGWGWGHSPLHLIFFKSKCTGHYGPCLPTSKCPKHVLGPRHWGQDLRNLGPLSQPPPSGGSQDPVAASPRQLVLD